MKRLVITMIAVLLAMTHNAQDVYTCGYYINGHGRATAAIWENGTVLYEQLEQGDYETPSFAVTTNRDVYWTYGNKILKNDDIISSCNGMVKNMIYDESQMGLIITGFYYDSFGTPQARIWDGQGAVVYDLDSGEAYKTACCYNQDNTQLYTCGYVIGGEGQKSATVWINGGITNGGETITIDNGSAAVDLAMHNGELYVLFYETVIGTLYNTYTMKLWRDGEILHTYNNDASALEDWHLCFYNDDIVVGGQPAGGPATLWKNGEIYHTYNEFKVTAMDAGSDGVYVATLNDWKPKIWRDNIQIYSFPNYTEFYDMHVLSSDAVGEHAVTNDIIIFPNPLTDNSNIKLSPDVQCQSVELYTLDGRLVKTCHGASQQTTINVENLNTGVYILKIRMADGKEFAERIVKE